MTKLVQNDIASLTNEQSALAALNSNSASLEVFSDTVLSRDGTTPNQMDAQLDMNSHRVINLPAPISATEPLRLQDLLSFTGGTLNITDGATRFTALTDCPTSYASKGLQFVRVKSNETGLEFTTQGAGIVSPGPVVVDNAIVRWDGTTGLNVQNSGVFITDTGIINGGSTSSSTLTLESTTGTGITDKILFNLGSQLEAASFETCPVTGGIAILGNNGQIAGSLTPGSGYTNGTYNNVNLTGGTGTGAKATIVVAGGVVSTATITTAGSGYTFGDVVSATAASIGGTGSGFSVRAGVGNSYAPPTGQAKAFYHANIGSADNIATIPNTKFDIPGIGPLPAAGQMFIMANYNDFTFGNISNIYAVAKNQGTRYCAAITGVGVADGTAAGVNLWGGQFSAVARNSAGGVLTGANIECDHGSGTVTSIALQLKIGDTGAGGTNPGNSYISSLADAGRGPTYGWRIQASNTNPIATAGSIIGVEGSNCSCTNGIDFSTATFSGFAFKGASIAGGSSAGSILTLKGTSSASPSGDRIKMMSNAKDILHVRQNPAGDVGGTYLELWPGNTVSSQNAEFDVISSNTNAGLSFRMKGTGVMALHAPADQSGSAAFALYENELNGTDRMVFNAAASIPSSFTLIWPAAVPASTAALTSTSGGVMAFSTAVNTAHGSQLITSSTTFTPAAGVYAIYAEAWGGGGGGGRYTGVGTVPGSGGGGGGYSAAYIATTPGTGITATIGAGGTGSTGANAGAGGTTTFSPLSAGGGGGGGDNGAGAGGGGTASGGTLNIQGKTGLQPTANTQVWGGDAARGGPGGVTGIDGGAAAGGVTPGGGGGPGSHNGGVAQNGAVGGGGAVMVWW